MYVELNDGVVMSVYAYNAEERVLIKYQLYTPGYEANILVGTAA